MYIVFFALSPPAFVSTILSSPIGMSASFGVAVYVALYHSKAIGALLIVALLASMTQVTEHLTPKAERTLDEINKDIADLKKAGLTETSDNEAMKKLVEERKQLDSRPIPDDKNKDASVDRPSSAGSTAASPPTTPAPTAAAPPKPTMSCNLENFADY